ncbi:condensation domain-containing protein [Spirillospora sp. NPDC050679]
MRSLPSVWLPVPRRRAKSGPVGCGQYSIWLDITEKPDGTGFFNPSADVEVPDGATLDDVLAELAELLRRFESLCTVYERDSSGELRQSLLTEGRVEVRLLEHDGPGIPWPEVNSYRARVQRESFDLAAEPPFRATVVLAGGRPVLVLMHTPHITADGGGIINLADELDRLIAASAAGAPRPPARPARQPLEQAAHERSPHARRRIDRAAGHWARQLDQAPRTMFPGPLREAPGDPYHATVLYSRAAALALNALVVRQGTSGSTALLTATALVLGAFAEQPACTLQIISANRFQAAEQDAVTCMIQAVPVTLDLAEGTVQDAMARAWTAAISAYRNGVYDRARVRALAAEAEQRRREHLDLSAYFNDMRKETARDPALAEAATPDVVRAALDDTLVRTEPAVEQVAFALYAEDAPDRVRLTLHADARRIDADEARSLLHGVERLLAEAAFRDVGLAEVPEVTGVRPRPRGPGRWHLLRRCWTDLDAVAALVSAAAPGAAVEVAMEGAEPEVVARVRYPGPPPVTEAEIHRACMAALPGHPSAVAPRRYLLSGQDAPSAPSPAAARFGGG